MAIFGSAPLSDDDQSQVVETPGQFSKGLRSGFYGAGSQLQSAAGGAAEAMGETGFAQDRYAAARALQAKAQESAPRVTSFTDVRGLRDAFDYGTGIFGQAIPSIGASLVGGLAGAPLGPGGAVAGAALASTPFEVGDVVQRQQNDPVSLRLPAGERFEQALLGGGASAVLQGIVPGGVATKVVGKAAAPAIREAVKDAGGNIVKEGVFEAGGEVVKQGAHMLSNPDKALDPMAVAEAGVAGAIGGAPLAGVGLAGDVARSAAQSPGNVLSDVVERGKQLVGSDPLGKAGKAATDAAAKARDTIQDADPVEAIKGLYDQGSKAAREFWDQVQQKADVADLGKVRELGDKVREHLPQLDAERVQRVKEGAEELLAKAGLDEDTRAQLTAAMADLTDRGNQAIVAGIKNGYEAAQALGEKTKRMTQAFGQKATDTLDAVEPQVRRAYDVLSTQATDLYDEFTLRGGAPGIANEFGQRMRAVYEENAPKVKAKGGEFAAKARDLYNTYAPRGQEAAAEFGSKFNALIGEYLPGLKGTKKSEDFSGVREVIRQKIIPALKRSHPHLFENSQTIAEAAEGLRIVLDTFSKNGKEGLTSDQIASLMDTFGPDEAVNVLDAAYKAVGKNDRAELAKFAEARNAVLEQQQADKNITDFMMKSLNPELQEGTPTSVVHQELKALRSFVKRIERETSAEISKMEMSRMMFVLESRYGKNADKILAAVEKEVKQEKNLLDDENALLGTSAKTRAAKLQEERAEGRSMDGTVEEGANLGKTTYYGREVEVIGEDGKKRKERTGMSMHPDLDPAGEKGQAIQALERARKEEPGKDVSFITAEELGEDHPIVQAKLKQLMNDLVTVAGKGEKVAMRMAREALKQYGIVAAEGSRDLPGYIDRSNIRKVMVAKEEGEKAKTSHREHASTFKVGDFNYDAIALTKEMDRQFSKDYDATDEKSTPHRTGRMFMAGVAALMDRLGVKIDVPDTLVIDHNGTTFGQVKNLDYTPPNALTDRLEAKIKELRKQYAAEKDPQQRAAIRERAFALLEHAKSFDPRMDRSSMTGKLQTDRSKLDPFEQVEHIVKDFRTTAQDMTQDEEVRGADPDPRGNIHELKDKVEPLLTDMAGQSTKKSKAPDPDRLAGKEVKGIIARLDKLAAEHKSAGGQKIVERARELLANLDVLPKSVHKTLRSTFAQADAAASAIGKTVNFLHDKFKSQFVAQEVAASADPKEGKTKYSLIGAKAPLVAVQRDGKWVLIDDASGEWVALGHKLEREDDTYASKEDAEQAAKEYAGKQSAQSATGPRTWTGTDQEIQDVRTYIDRVLGPMIKTALAKIPHAGEFKRMTPHDVIRISVHALNPMSVAHHEAMHAFFAKLMDQGNTKVGQVLERAAMSAHVQEQLRRLLHGESAALAQLADPEEAAAYMYQFWAAGQLQIGPSKSILIKIRDMILDVFGVWSKDRRAQHILDYFHSGQFATSGLGQPNAVARALLEPGRNAALDKVQEFTKPLMNIAESLLSAGGTRLRDSGIPALRELANLMKLDVEGTGRDHGFIPAASTERARVLNEFASKLRGYDQVHLDDALAAMQKGQKATTTQGKTIQLLIQHPKVGLLPTMLEYMRKAGVDVMKIQPDASYFPRKYDAEYISRHQTAFQTILERHGLTKAEARAITLNLSATDGAEFTVETDRPGMQHLKPRMLKIPDSELAPFMSKDLFEILGSYITQATRRAEWARRFQDDGLGISRILAEAKAQGATPEQLDTARKYVRAIDGTLGDGLNPTARRIMGNVLVYQNIRLLPLAIFSSVVDPLGIAVRGGTMKDSWETFKRGVKEIRNTFRDTYTTDAETKMAEALGTIDDAMLTHTMSSLYTQGMVGDTAKKWNEKFFRYNLMEGFNRSMRVGATQAAIKFLERHADGTASPHSIRWLAELGLQPGDYKGDFQDAKTVAAINRWVDGAVLRPDAADKPIWMSDPHWMLISHLKQFIYSFQETILKRVVHEHRNGNYKPAMALASYVPVMIAADLMKGLIQGGGELPEWKKSWGPADYLGAGIERAGMLGTGSFLSGGVGTLAGPTLDQLHDVASAIEGKASASSTAVKALPANAVLPI